MASPSAFAVGCTVQLQLSNGDRVQGEVFAYDERADCVVLRHPSGAGPSRFDVRLLRGNQVRARGWKGGGRWHVGMGYGGQGGELITCRPLTR